MQNHYQNVQEMRAAELDSKRNKILIEMNRKAEQEKVRKERKKKEAIRIQQLKEEEKEKKLNDREAERKRMREDMQKRKAQASKNKTVGGFQVEIAGAEEVQDLLNERPSI